MSKSILLAQSGFIKSKYAELYAGKSDKERVKIAKPEHADEEVWEEVKNQFLKTGYPMPLKRYRIIWESPNLAMETPYFWCVNYIGKDIAFPHIIKTIDVFAAAENSAFFGVSQQRIGLQQDKVSQFLATSGKMIKEIFQLVRELRIIDERVDYYQDSYVGKESAEIALKGIWIDMVEGGAKNPSSVFGMSREVQFTSLPDLFFSTNPKSSDDVDEYVETSRAQFNKSVRNVLKRKLKMFMIWKERTWTELQTRRIFTLKFLRQHYAVIKMYITWVKPYLRHIRRLTLDDDKVMTADMVSAFEGSMVEVEFLAHKEPIGRWYACILASFLYRTRPSMSFQQEGYQRGPIHVGKIELNFRSYMWTKDQIDNFQKFRDREDMDLMRSISDSLADAIDAMGGDLEKYLEEAEYSQNGTAPIVTPTMAQRLKADFFGPAKAKKPKKPKINALKDNANKSKAKSELLALQFLVFKNFKKQFRMIMW